MYVQRNKKKINIYLSFSSVKNASFLVYQGICLSSFTYQVSQWLVVVAETSVVQLEEICLPLDAEL